MHRVIVLVFSFIAAAAIVGLADPSAAYGAAAPQKPISGCVNQALTNGLWNLKVTEAKLTTLPDSATPAWAVTFAFGNAGSAAAMPNDLGVAQPQLWLADGTTLDMTTDSELKYQRAISMVTLRPGFMKTGTYYYVPDDPATKATAFDFPVAYSASYGYRMKNPGFNVDLTCKKP